MPVCTAPTAPPRRRTPGPGLAPRKEIASAPPPSSEACLLVRRRRNLLPGPASLGQSNRYRLLRIGHLLPTSAALQLALLHRLHLALNALARLWAVLAARARLFRGCFLTCCLPGCHGISSHSSRKRRAHLSVASGMVHGSHKFFARLRLHSAIPTSNVAATPITRPVSFLIRDGVRSSDPFCHASCTATRSAASPGIVIALKSVVGSDPKIRSGSGAPLSLSFGIVAIIALISASRGSSNSALIAVFGNSVVLPVSFFSIAAMPSWQTPSA